MKNLPGLLLAGAVMLALGVACDKGEPKPDPGPGPVDKPFPEPVDVAFTIYSLEGTACEWTNIDWSLENIHYEDVRLAYKGKLLIIDDDETLSDHIAGTDYPPVDFSEKSLLLAYGLAPDAESATNNERLQQVSTLGYLLSINVITGDLTALSEWQTAFVVDKLDKNSKTELSVTRNGRKP